MQFDRKPKVNTRVGPTVHWVWHVLKNVIELYPIQKWNVVVLLKMLRLSLKPKILHNFKTTWVFFKIENGPNSVNAKPLCAFTKLSIASFCKKVIENISAVSIVKNECCVWPEWCMNRQGSIKCSVACQWCYQYDFSTRYVTITSYWRNI